MSPRVTLPTRDPETPDVEDGRSAVCQFSDAQSGELEAQSLHSNIGRVVVDQYQMALKKPLRFRSNLHTAGGSFLHVHLILPFDTPLIFWGIFWLNRAKAKIRKGP